MNYFVVMERSFTKTNFVIKNTACKTEVFLDKNFQKKLKGNKLKT